MVPSLKESTRRVRCAHRYYAHLVMRTAHPTVSASRQKGYILLPVVVLITLISVVAFLLNHKSALGTGTTGSLTEAQQAEQVARAGLAHARWWTQTNGCLGDQTMTTVPFGPAGAHSYTGTVDSAATTTKSTIVADQDAWINEGSPDNNFGTDNELSTKNKAGGSFRALYRYDLSAIAPGTPIAAATAWFYITANDAAGPVNVHRVNAAWTEGDVTWNTTASSFDPQTQAMISPQPASGVWVSVNLTSLAQAWVNDPANNHGIMLIALSSDVESKYASREYAAGERPYLQITTADTRVSPVTLTATGTLDSGVSRTLTTNAVTAYQPPATLFLQPDDADGKDAWLTGDKPSWNYGNFALLRARQGGGGHWHSPIQFDLDGLPHGARIVSAILELYRITGTQDAPGPINLHTISKSWEEGDNNGGTGPGVTWDYHKTGTLWNTAGGDYDVTPAAIAELDLGTDTWFAWDITATVQRWADGIEKNNGLMLVAGDAGARAEFASSDESNPVLRPKLTIRYACECGVACLAPQGSGRIALIGDDSSPDPDDQLKIKILKSWGYEVDFYEDQNSDTINWSNYDLAYVSETVISGDVSANLTNLSIGVVNEEPKLYDDLQLASGNTEHVGSSIDITDNSHYISSIFPPGELSIYDGGMEILTADTPLAGGLQTLGEYSGAASLTAMDQGAPTTSGTAAGRRVTLPLGQHFAAKFNWTQLNNNGRLMVQRAIAWGMKADIGSAGNVLMVVGNPGSLTTQESAKKALMESWDFTVNLIDESDSQANFDTAIAANDVAYIPQDISSTNLGTKLRNATIGVVNEEGEQVDELGFSQEKIFKSNQEINVVDNSHYITQPFATGFLTFSSSSQSVHMLSGQITPGLQTLGETLNTGSQYKPSLATLDAGDDLFGGGTAAGRRVELPWGGGTFDINLLTDDGRTIMQRALVWGAGAGSAPSYAVLLVVGDAATLSSKDAGRKTLIESWGHTVTLIDDGDTQANFDAAASSSDVVFVTGSVSGGTLGNKLTGSSAPIVNEFNGKLDNFGFSSGTSTFALADGFTKTDALHYITEPFSGNPVTVFSGSLSMPVPSGTLAPGLANAGEVTGIPALVTLDAGATRYDGNPAPARRAHLPFASAETTDLTADGETILQRALEWAAGESSGATPQQILLVVADASSLSAQDLARKTLMEGWGYGVKTISASDSQANFDAAVVAADAAYVVEQQQSTALGTKLRNATVAVISEEAELRQDIGFSANRDWPSTRDTVDIVDNSHYITSPFATGLLTIASAPIEVVTLSGQMAGGLQVLGQQDWGGPQNSLSVIETGGALYGGGTAAGRRVQLPWGRTGFDINALNTHGLKLMQRAIEWGIAGGGGGGGGPPPAGPVFEEFTDASRSSNGTSLIISKPAATAVGDLLLAAVATDGDNTSSLAPPAGWNVINVADRAREVTFGVWWKLAGASESNSYTFSWSSSEQAYGWIMRFTGHDPVSPIDANSNDIGSTASPSSPSVTTTVNNTLILRLGGFDDDDITVGAPGLSGHTAINMNDSGNGNFTASGGSGYVLQAAAGGSGTSSFTLTNTEGYVTVTIAIAPAP